MTDRWDFVVQVTDSSGRHQVCPYICSPVLLDEYPGRWTCFVGWTGPLGLERPAFGATPLQAASLALALLQTLLAVRFPEAEFRLEGQPFFLPPGAAE